MYSNGKTISEVNLVKETLSSVQFKLSLDAFFYSFKKLVAHETQYVFLESGRGGRYSIAAMKPVAQMQTNAGQLQVSWSNGEVDLHTGEPLHALEKIVAQWQVERRLDLPEFQGGAIGFATYDYARSIERLPDIAKDDLQVPDLFFYLFDHWAVHDAKTNEITLMKLASSTVDLQQWLGQWQEVNVQDWERQFYKEQAVDVKPSTDELGVSFEKPDFEAAVRKIQEYIAAGDVFQVNLAVRQHQKLVAPPLSVYEAVRSFNPSPYMAYIASEDFAVVSGSPELLVKKDGENISTRPIAGTRPRGKDDAEDLALANELIQHEKERAEHVMLVDLERNDLGKVARYGTVEVDEFMVIEKYSHVMHIVSNVRGKIDPLKSNADVLRAMFPGGTITGAPKIRTMEIIEELEPVRRGLYTGSIGWLGYTGDMEFNIVIRTAFIQDGKAYIQAGAGIVIDSIPENEYIESLNKAKAMWQAKAMAEEVTQ